MIDPDVTEATAPAAWASYLINGDASGLTWAEQSSANAWALQATEGHRWHIVDCGEPWFTWSFRLYGGDYQGGEVCDYTMLRTPRAHR